MITLTHAACAIESELVKQFPDVLSTDATDFIAALEREFASRREEILQARTLSASRVHNASFDFLGATARIRNDPDWRVPAPPCDLIDRRVEIAAPAENRKVVINALNAHAQVWVADLEDALSPTGRNVMLSQRNLHDAVVGDITYVDPRGKQYRLDERTAAIVVRPRGWHLPEHHILIDGRPASASLVDFGLYFFHCARKQLERGSGPYFYLPKLENHLEARLWNDVFEFAQDWIGIARGSIRATVIVEHINAAYEMDEILYALGPHAAGLTAGRWDYLFSIAREFRHATDFAMPDRSELKMNLPFMRAYTELLIRTCHRRGTHAIGGVATQIPDRHDAKACAQAVAAVRTDKEREAEEGFDGTWVVHPDLVAVCHTAFERILAGRPHQINRLPSSSRIAGTHLSPAHGVDGQVTEAGLRSNIALSIRYLDGWLCGSGSIRLFDLMEGVATVEIARSQIWIWLHRRARLQDGRRITPALVRTMLDDEITQYVAQSPDQRSERSLDEARALFEAVTMNKDFPDFLTLPGYERLNRMPPASDPANGAATGDKTAAAQPRPAPMQPPVRRTDFRLTCSSGMFTHLQLKPRVAFSFAFMGWSAWLIEHAVSHATLIREHATGFVPIGLEIEYLQFATFDDCETLDISTQVRTWNPRRFHSLQEVDVLLDASGIPLARIHLQEVCVRIESQETLAAAPGRVPDEISALLLDSPGDIDERPRLLNRGAARVSADAKPIAAFQHDFTVYRHACEVSDQWYSEHVCDYLGASRESMVFQLLPDHPALAAGLARPVERISIGLRQPYALFDRGQVATEAYRIGDEIHFAHRLLTASGTLAGDAIEVFSSL
ncbi:malate synthase A [Paraburkholderia phenazinium]|uniref:malate synthase n=1 Tax=Paraburkholderia phenazinium TaxID=60549 RepID=A0A1G8N0C6_9BURK|nr:malate synthase A [Paraburkholderia phenazinium]SDI73699.1 malate synthase A [Paraburkholderia phenazinium]